MLRAAILAALFPLAAIAAETPPFGPADPYCTDGDGRRVELGQVICIRASCRSWLARCDMSLNSPMWRKIEDGCPAVTLTDEPALARTPAS